MNLNKCLFSLLFLICTSQFCTGQKYFTAAGFQASNKEIGVTVQQLISGPSTTEIILALSTENFVFIPMYKYHRKILAKGLNTFVGAGPHVGKVFDDRWYYGLSGITGIEFKFPVFPMLISGSIRTDFRLQHKKSFEALPTFSVRYILIRLKDRKKKLRKKRKTRNKKYKSGGINYKKN